MNFFNHPKNCAPFFCRENDLRVFFVAKTIYVFFVTSFGKFLRVESCHPESLDFLGLWGNHCRKWGGIIVTGEPFSNPST